MKSKRQISVIPHAAPNSFVRPSVNDVAVFIAVIIAQMSHQLLMLTFWNSKSVHTKFV